MSGVTSVGADELYVLASRLVNAEALWSEWAESVSLERRYPWLVAEVSYRSDRPRHVPRWRILSRNEQTGEVKIEEPRR